MNHAIGLAPSQQKTKVSREEALEMVKDTRSKLTKLHFTFTDAVFEVDMKDAKIVNYQSAYNERLELIDIWLKRYANNFNKEAYIESDGINDVADLDLIHNDNAKVDYRINYLASMVARMTKYGERSSNPEQFHAMLQAIDYTFEAIGYLEKINERI